MEKERITLYKSKLSEIPEGAIVITEKEALEHQIKTIKNWNKFSDVYAIRYGPYALGLAALLGGVYFNNYFRRKFFLGHYGRLSTYLPICFFPGCLSVFGHLEIVYKKIVLMNFDECPLCLQMRAAAFQTSVGVLYPAVMAPVGGAVMAMRYSTYDLPYLHQEPKKVFNIFRNMYSKIHSKTLYMFIGQAFLASVVTHLEMKNIIKVNEKLLLQEKELLHN